MNKYFNLAAFAVVILGSLAMSSPSVAVITNNFNPGGLGEVTKDPVDDVY